MSYTIPLHAANAQDAINEARSFLNLEGLREERIFEDGYLFVFKGHIAMVRHYKVEGAREFHVLSGHNSNLRVLLQGSTRVKKGA